MATVTELSLMAGCAYKTTRADINRFPVPDGWIEIDHKTQPSGFEAVYFQNAADPKEIVISFAGTGPNLFDPDMIANCGLATGSGSAQILDAAKFYLETQALYRDANITFTGHSLGGGLAALMGVFFGKQTVTFDQAPFALSAISGVPTDLKRDLLLNGFTDEDLADLTKYLQVRDTYGGIPFSGLVRNFRVDGEFCSAPPLSLLNRIGTYDAVWSHGPYSVPSTDMHAVVLLTAFQQSAGSGDSHQTLSEVTKKLTNLLEMFFDKNLYAYKTDDPDNKNLLEHLIRNQEGLDPAVPNDGDHMLDRFTEDMWKIAQDGGQTMTTDSNLTKALIAFAMQAYYDNKLPGSEEKLFSDDGISGGLRFNRSDIADTLDAVKGYQNDPGSTKYFQDFLLTLPEPEQTKITAQLPDLLDWFITTGNQAMTAAAVDKRAFMLGGMGGDNLTGGSQADVSKSKGVDNNNWYWRLAA